MMKRALGVMLTVMLVAGLSGIAQGETIEEVEKALIASSKNLKSYEADMTISGEMKMEGFSMVTNGTGHMEFKQEGGTQYSRTEMTTSVVTNTGGQETKMESKSLMITDGEFAYMVNDSMGQKMASKSKLPATSSGAAHEDMFKELAETNTLKVLPSESVDGEDAYVIEMTPKAAAGAGSSTMYYAKRNGMWLKMVSRGPDGKPMQTVTLTNIKVNGNIAASRFEFVAPPGVEVMDMTQY